MINASLLDLHREPGPGRHPLSVASSLLSCRTQATSRLLNNLGDGREAVLRAARDTQWEYEDEYDDSFDAMGGGAMDGVADVEGEPRESRDPGCGSAAPGIWPVLRHKCSALRDVQTCPRALHRFSIHSVTTLRG